MNWPNEVVEKCADNVGLAVSAVWKKTKHSPRFRAEVAKAALSSITLQDIEAVLKQHKLMIVSEEFGR